MTKKGFTELVFILDRSGSMFELTQDTIGGFNSFLQEQKEKDEETRLTTILFDSLYEVLHDGVDIHKVEPITKKQYYTRDSTALLDAIGKTINKIGKKLSEEEEDQRPEHVLIVITTDGEENDSREFTWEMVKGMVDHQTQKYNWKFIFMGANIDSIKVARDLSIGHTSNYSATSRGVKSMYMGASAAMEDIQKSGDIDEDWKKDVE